MAMVKLIISVPKRIKAQLDTLRKEGTSASGFIRNLLEKEFKHRKERSKPNQEGGHYGQGIDQE